MLARAADVSSLFASSIRKYHLSCRSLILDGPPEISRVARFKASIPRRMSVQVWQFSCSLWKAMIWEAGMLDLSIENVANVAVIRCSGRIVRSSDAYQLRNGVDSELHSRDISEVEEVEGGGLGMLVF